MLMFGSYFKSWADQSLLLGLASQASQNFGTSDYAVYYLSLKQTSSLACSISLINLQALAKMMLHQPSDEGYLLYYHR